MTEGIWTDHERELYKERVIDVSCMRLVHMYAFKFLVQEPFLVKKKLHLP